MTIYFPRYKLVTVKTLSTADNITAQVHAGPAIPWTSIWLNITIPCFKDDTYHKADIGCLDLQLTKFDSTKHTWSRAIMSTCCYTYSTEFILIQVHFIEVASQWANHHSHHPAALESFLHQRRLQGRPIRREQNNPNYINVAAVLNNIMLQLNISRQLYIASFFHEYLHGCTSWSDKN